MKQVESQADDPVVRLLREQIEDLKVELGRKQYALQILLGGQDEGQSSELLRRKSAVESDEPSESLTAVSLNDVGQRLSAIKNAPPIAKLIIGSLERKRRGMHRKEMIADFEEQGFEVKPESVSATLSTLANQGKVVRGRYDTSANTVHWFLPDFLRTTADGKVHLMDGCEPISDIALRFGTENLSFD